MCVCVYRSVLPGGMAATLPSASTAVLSSGLRRSGTFLEHAENLLTLERELLKAFPGLSNTTHPAHARLKRARFAAERQHWETAYNEIFAAEETLLSKGNRSESRNPPTKAFAATSLKRTASGMVSEAAGEPRRVARRLLDEAGGNEGEALERALLIRDLEEGRNGFNSQVELNRGVVECSICTNRSECREAVRLRPCGHGWYCIACIQRAADTKISDGATASTMHCFECDQNISEALLRALLQKSQMERLHRQSLESAVSSCSTLWPCPTPNCANRVELADGVQPRLQCELCHKEHCLRCSASPYHIGKTCEEHLRHSKDADSEVALRKWMRDVGAKQCPNCQAVVTKQNLRSQGNQRVECHKMICRACKTRFCFGCLAVLTEQTSCGCTADGHGFIDPDTGAFVQHLKSRRQRASRATSDRH